MGYQSAGFPLSLPSACYCFLIPLWSKDKELEQVRVQSWLIAAAVARGGTGEPPFHHGMTVASSHDNGIAQETSCGRMGGSYQDEAQR